MDDDDFGADADFLAALAATNVPSNNSGGGGGDGGGAAAARPQQAQRIPPATAPRIQQPVPQRLPRPGSGVPSAAQPCIVQPTPQALPPPGPGAATGAAGPSVSAAKAAAVPSSGSTILVSPRQKGNPLLAQLRSVPWEYSDIVADYGLGTTTCALFLSLKYHRLHPEYIFARIRALQGRYRLRVLLALVDIANHEEPLRELAKTSLVNQVTLVLCWSAAEAARYLELYKAFENASGFAAIRGPQANHGGGAAAYAERLVQFATVPRAIHKADAVALVGAFGSVRRAVLADAEQLGLVPGWGEKKVQAWRRAVEAPFRVRKGGRKKKAPPPPKPIAAEAAAEPNDIGGDADDDDVGLDFDAVFNRQLDRAMPPPPPAPATDKDKTASAPSTPKRGTSAASTFQHSPLSRPPPAEELSDGVAAALAKLREKG